jgi:hypothetical protein
MMAAMDLGRSAAIAADPDAPLLDRVRAFVAAVERVSLGAGAPPESLADAVDDIALVDAVVAARRPDVVCAALRQLGERPELATTRRRVVRRLVVLGATGLPVAGLALEIGDLDTGARLAARDFVEHVAPRAGRIVPDPLVRAWLAWLARLEANAFRAVLGALIASGAELSAVLSHATDLDAARIASRRVGIESMLAPR